MKIFQAQIKEKKLLITAPGLMPTPVEGVGIPTLGQGGDSTGILIISESESMYIPNKTPDLSDNIDYIIAACNSIISALNSISGGVLDANAGGAITTGNFKSGIQSGVDGINQAINNLNNLKGRLK
uniref:Uncharacterized protein n=1 Tax=Dulem virus 29 TaxID=3145747 RepID=A0AAU8B2W7_9CAUD